MAIPFDVDFTSPGAATSLTITPEAMLYDPPSNPSALRIEWDSITTPPEDLYKAELWAIDSTTVTRILRFTDPAVDSYLYPYPRSKDETLYRLIIWVGSSGNYLTGLWGSDEYTHIMRYTSLVSVENPETNRVILQAIDDFSETRTQEQTFQVPAGGRNYRVLPGSLKGVDATISGRMFDRIDGSGVTQMATKNAFDALFDSGETFCLRQERGFKGFGVLNGSATLRYDYGGETISLSAGFRRTSYTEGISG